MVKSYRGKEVDMVSLAKKNEKNCCIRECSYEWSW